MEVFYKGRKNRTKAYGEYNVSNGSLTVKKGSLVSETVATFKGAATVIELRKKHTDENGVLVQDLMFDSASAAASFVAGYSVSGMLAWHVDKHVTLKDTLENGLLSED